MLNGTLYLVDLAGSERVRNNCYWELFRLKNRELQEIVYMKHALLIFHFLLLENAFMHLQKLKWIFFPLENLNLQGCCKILWEVIVKPLSLLLLGHRLNILMRFSYFYWVIYKTVSSLTFGQRAMKVENKPIINK